jgi:alkaline phosphatase D
MSDTTRRRFLQVMTVTASATALGLVGCDGDSNSSDGNPQPTPAAVAVPGEAVFVQGVASGDPRPNAVLLWTRASTVTGTGTLRVQLATDSGFTQRLVDSTFPVSAANDCCLKVRVLGLQPGTQYFYRFQLEGGATLPTSPVGRTRTARALTDATPLRFAFVSCQDFVGRYWNTLLPLLDQDLDFVLHLGDCVYETTGDPGFQGGGDAARRVVFRQPDEALRLGSGSSAFLAARTVDNYRDLHRTYRSDDVAKLLYQRFPVVAIWDDHEFSDDSWRDNGTYLDGRFEERDAERRRNAEQAYFEYMPVDTELGGMAGRVEVTRDRLFPNTVLYRKLRFGRDVELFLTDYRSYRPDHLIPEDAFPGTVVMDRDALTQVLAAGGVSYDAVRSRFSPYLDIDLPQFAPYKQVLLAVATVGYLGAGIETQQASLRAQNAVRGKIATTIIDTLVTQYNAQVPAAQRVPLLPAALVATLDTGVAWFTLGKTGLFGDVGSRYFVVKDTYDLYAAWRVLTQDQNAQNALGTTQTQWLVSQVAASTAKWKLIASSVSLTSMVLDLTVPALGVPPPFNQRFYLNVDQWDGFPQQRDALLKQALGDVPGVVFLSGDIHASFAGTHAGRAATHVEFTTPAISSTPFRTLLQTAAEGDPLLAPLAGRLIPSLDPLLRAGNPAIAYAQTTHHGVAIAQLDSEAVTVRIQESSADKALVSRYATGQAADRTVAFRWNGTQLQNVTARAVAETSAAPIAALECALPA